MDLVAATGRGAEHSWLEPGHQVTNSSYFLSGSNFHSRYLLQDFLLVGPDPGSQTIADMDPDQTLPPQKVEFLHEKYT